ncbi:hypothetical protein EC968_003494 [Mortierella alpina]|nr:hypothetical protein EC968_003494 [Mortierella alpina]
MPMFWNHHQQARSRKRVRKQEQFFRQDKPSAASNNVMGEDAEGVRQRAIDDTSSRIRYLKPPPPLKQATQSQQYHQAKSVIKSAEQRREPLPLRKLTKVGNKTLDKSTARARIEDGISTLKTMFDSVFGTDPPGSEALDVVPDSIFQAAMPLVSPSSALVTSDKDETSSAPEHCQAPTSSSVPSPCTVEGTGASETFRRALHESEHKLEETATATAAAAAIAKGSDSENDSLADQSSSKTKKSVIIINDHEYKHDHARMDDPDQDHCPDKKSVPDQTPRMDPVAASGSQYMETESEEFMLPFLPLQPSTQGNDFLGSDLFYTGTVLQRTLASFALVLFGLFLFLLVISYKMQARRRTASSPLAFLQYLTRGVFFSPFSASHTASAPSSNRSWTRPSFLFAKSPTSLLGRSGSGAVLPEPVVACSSSSKTGSIMTDLRRTSASQHHLQQQLETAQVAYKVPV